MGEWGIAEWGTFITLATAILGGLARVVWLAARANSSLEQLVEFSGEQALTNKKFSDRSHLHGDELQKHEFRLEIHETRLNNHEKRLDALD